MPENVLIVAGEDSGDTLGSEIVKELVRSKYNFFGVGGAKMQAAGVERLFTTEDTAIMGFVEVLRALPRVLRMIRTIRKACRERKVRWAILVDFPGFNLPLAKRLHKQGVRCIQVVSPQIWAWHYSRIHKIKEVIDTVLCLYEFEVDIYEKEGARAEFMGHPLVNIAAQNQRKFQQKKPQFKDGADRLAKKHIVAILPGSRGSEVKRHFGFMLEAAARLRDRDERLVFRIPVANELVRELISDYDLPDYVKLTDLGTHAVLATSTAALACSGTVTMECCLFGVPFVLVYRSSAASAFIARRVARIPYVGMVNVIFGDFVTKEFLQEDMTVDQVLPELERIVFDTGYRKQMTSNLGKVKRGLGKGKAASRAAKIIRGRVENG